MLQVDSISQSQSLSEPKIFQVIPKQVFDHIVVNATSSENSADIIKAIHEDMKHYLETGKMKVTSDTTLSWNIEGKKNKQTLPEGFKLNSIERVLVYISIFTVLYQLIVNDPSPKIEVNQTFINQCEHCYIELSNERGK